MSMKRTDQAREAVAMRLYAASKPANLVAPPTYTNAAMKAPYVRPVMASPRAEADDNLQHASRDSGAQITRCL